MTYTARLSFKLLPCNKEYKTGLSLEEAKRQVEKWREECGENNPNDPLFEIFEEEESL